MSGLHRCGFPSYLQADATRAGLQRRFPEGGTLMGKQTPRCGLRWPVCPLDLGQRLSCRAGVARCPVCYRRWPLAEVQPCPWPARVRLWDQNGRERVVCRSHAAHPSVARLVAIEEDP